MSGIVGLLRADGAPLAPAALVPFVEFLRSRGPHGDGVWQEGCAALGHTLLRTTRESSGETQPFASEDRLWIVADARIDARAELIDSLGVAEQRRLMPAPDVELILQAYLRWGEDCVDHLLGDFAFAIWNGLERRLFCARDQLGVKPFYYAHTEQWVVFSNSLECVRRHPAVPDTLNDLAIADCLLFGSNRESGTTVYRDVQRLPAGHTLTWSHKGLALRRYWSPPIDEPVYYRRDRDYIDRFDELLQRAVSDRLRVDRASIFMSGGIDSTLLAATTARLLSGRTQGKAVHAYTFVYDSLIEDSERMYAEAAARHLDIPITVCPLDEHPQWIGSDTPATPEPLDNPTDRGPQLRLYAEMAAHSPVAFFGEGPDNALHYEWRPHLTYLYRQRRWGRLLADVAKHMRRHKRIPLVPTIPRMLRERRSSEESAPLFPQWLNSRLVERLRLRERWHQLGSGAPSLHPTRPIGHGTMMSPMWQALFEAFDTAYTGALFEVRHPYVDIRLVRFMLSVPALPWCRKKHLVRLAARPLLPRQILSRTKTPLSAVPEEEHVRRHGMPSIYPSSALRTYTDVERLAQDRSSNAAAMPADFRLAALSHWLSTRASLAHTA
jgi:asparagine synthase (glutamine-hydrolysing)